MFRKMKLIGMLIIVAILAIINTGTATATPVWNVTTMDSIGDVGRYPSLVLNSSGNPEIAYDDFTNAALKYAVFNGSSWQLETVAPGGRGNSLAIDKNGDPDISTVQPYGYNLTYCHWNGASWDTQVVVPGGGLGLGSSLALNNIGYPSISYTRLTSADSGIRLASWNGTSWQISTVFSGDTGWYSSLAFDSQNRPCISFCDNTGNNSGYLQYAYYDGSTWHVQNVDTIGFGTIGIQISMKLDNLGNPHILYESYAATYNSTGSGCQLKYASWNGSAWIIQVVDNSSDMIIAPSLALNQNQNPYVSYYDETAGLVKWAVLNGPTWDSEAVDNIGVGNTVFTSLALDGSGNPHIAYYDCTKNDLKYAEKPLTSANGSVGTSVTVQSGSGSGSSPSGAPYVEGSWVQEPDSNITLWNGDTSTVIAEDMESGDPLHLTPGTQINPPMIFDSSKTINFYTVVGDPDGVGSLNDVYGYVYSPSNSPAPYNTPTDPNGNPFFKYKVTYTNLGNGPAAQALVTAAYNAGLVTFGTVPTTGNDQYATSESWTGSYTLSNLVNSSGTGELQKNVADLYMGQGVLTYEQPAGIYCVNVYAEDSLDYVSPALMNPFCYLPLTGVETDFTSINYGAVALKIDKTIAGDVTWNSPAGVNNATVRNIGNTWAQVTVAQDDEGFGVDGTEAPVAYVGTTPPTFSSTPTSGVSTNWNVYFDACMGSNGANAEMYYTPTAKGSPMTNVVTLPGVLGLSTMNELDFSIYINDGNGSHSGSMTISSVYVPFGAAGATANGGGVVTTEPAIIYTPIAPPPTTTTAIGE